MNQKYCLDKKEWKEAQAALLLAKQLGLIEDAGIGALEKRRAEKNEKNRMEMSIDKTWKFAGQCCPKILNNF